MSKIPHSIKPTDVKPIREAVEAAQRFAHATTLEGCDVGDIDELIASIERNCIGRCRACKRSRRS